MVSARFSLISFFLAFISFSDSNLYACLCEWWMYIGAAVIPVINQLRNAFKWDFILFSQDCHPRNHVSFYENHRDNPDVRLSHTYTCTKGMYVCTMHGIIRILDDEWIMMMMMCTGCIISSSPSTLWYRADHVAYPLCTRIMGISFTSWSGGGW